MSEHNLTPTTNEDAEPPIRAWRLHAAVFVAAIVVLVSAALRAPHPYDFFDASVAGLGLTSLLHVAIHWLTKTPARRRWNVIAVILLGLGSPLLALPPLVARVKGWSIDRRFDPPVFGPGDRMTARDGRGPLAATLAGEVDYIRLAGDGAEVELPATNVRGATLWLGGGSTAEIVFAEAGAATTYRWLWLLGAIGGVGCVLLGNFILVRPNRRRH